MATDWHQFYEEVDPDPRQRVKSWIRIRIKAKKPDPGPHPHNDDSEHSSRVLEKYPPPVERYLCCFLVERPKYRS